MSTPEPRFVVLKFGGTSVATPARWATISAEARKRLAEGLRPVVVCSAVTKVSDLLERIAREAVANVRKHSRATRAAISTRMNFTFTSEAARVTGPGHPMARLIFGASAKAFRFGSFVHMGSTA